MDEDLIDALAAVFTERLSLEALGETRDNHYGTILEDIVAVASVIHDFQPTYDLRYFYRNAGYPEPYPHHEM